MCLLFVFPKLGTLCLTSLLRNLLESKIVFLALTFFLVPGVAWLFRSGAESFVSRSQDSPRSDAADLCCGRRKPSRLAFRSDLNGRVDLYTIKAANNTNYAVFCIFSIEKALTAFMIVPKRTLKTHNVAIILNRLISTGSREYCLM